MLGFKFEQYRTISEEFDFLRGEGGGARGLHLKILFSIIIGEHRKMFFFFKFHQNRAINEEFDSWGFKGPRGFQGTPISKIQKTPHTERWS